VAGLKASVSEKSKTEKQRGWLPATLRSMPTIYFGWLSYYRIKESVLSLVVLNRMPCTRLQPQRLKHIRAFVFPANDRKSKPPAMQVIVDPPLLYCYMNWAVLSNLCFFHQVKGVVSMFTRNASVDSRELQKGTRIKTLAWGSKTMMVEFNIQQNSSVPRHHHPHEQIGYLVAGRMQLSVGDQTHDVGPGDSWCIPADVPHAARAEEDCVVIEVFSPPRQDYLPQK
jgi:quercetin dioxygenase-like cupin family protein